MDLSKSIASWYDPPAARAPPEPARDLAQPCSSDAHPAGAAAEAHSRTYVESLYGYLPSWKSYASLQSKVIKYPSVAWNLFRSVVGDRSYISVIDSTVLLGAVPLAGHLDELREAGVRGILTLVEDAEVMVDSKQIEAGGFRQMHMPIVDMHSPAQDELVEAVRFLQSFAERGERALVHCRAGKGRSATVAVCYVAAQYEMDAAQALRHVKHCRPQVSLTPPQKKAVAQFVREGRVARVVAVAPSVRAVPLGLPGHSRSFKREGGSTGMASSVALPVSHAPAAPPTPPLPQRPGGEELAEVTAAGG
ncbi:unnamed protein product [Pedinophyceae sp. YPF-701]|nr:unnamed protein product [Pedinophyceae sp. YPF-701]